MMAEVAPEGEHKIGIKKLHGMSIDKELFKEIVQRQKKASSRSEDEDIRRGPFCYSY